LGYIAGVKLEYQIIQLWLMLFKSVFKGVRGKLCPAFLALIPWDFLAMMFSEVVAFFDEKALFGIAMVFTFWVRTAIRTSVIFGHIHFSSYYSYRRIFGFINLFFTNIKILFMFTICYHSLSFNASPQKGVSYLNKYSSFSSTVR